ncbi:hypothetical protein [Actinosynnema sp. NPDC023587]|uniref:hypothetical protein n=1 Tax=Actinosynnema sp. NPDC023587 TaxID=3154695 RepID=UPI0033F32C34
MDFWGAVRTLRRRWYIAVPSAVVAVAVAAGMFLSIPTRYQSTGVMVLTTPAAGGTFSQKVTPEEAVKINPLLAFDGSLATTSQILAQILADPKTRESLGITKGSVLNYTATGGGQNGPFLFITGDSEDPETAETMVTTVMEFASKELEDQQRKLKAPESTFITSQVIVNPTEAEAQIGGKVRYAGAAFVLLMLLTTAATFGADSIMNNIKRRKEREKAAAADEDEPEPEPAQEPRQAVNGAPRRTPTPPLPKSAQTAPPTPPAPTPPARRAQPTASEQTVKVKVPGTPTGIPAAKIGQRGQAKPGGLTAAQQAQPGTPPGGVPVGKPGQPPQNTAQNTPGKPPPKPQPTASEKTVKIAVPPPAPTWPSNEDRS